MTGRGTRSPGRILTQIFGVGVVHADPHPGHVHVTTDGDLVLPGPGLAGRREHARQLRLGQAITAIATHRAGPLRDGLLDPACSPGGPQDRRPGIPGGPVPGTGFQLSAEYQRFAEAPNSRSPACAVTPPQPGHPTPTTSNEPQNGEEAGQAVCRATCSRRAEMTIMHGRSQPGAVSPTRTERRKCVSRPQRPASPRAGCSADQSAARWLVTWPGAARLPRRHAGWSGSPLLVHQVQLAAARGIVTGCWPGPAMSPRCAGLLPTGIGAAGLSRGARRMP